MSPVHRETKDSIKVAHAVGGHGLIAVLRSADTKYLLPVAEVLFEAGIRVFELTLTTRGAVEMVKKLVDEFGAESIIGVGTVLDGRAAALSIEAGAQFLVTPSVSIEVIHVALSERVAIYSGGLTPTEFFTSWQAGATAVKLFPASSVSPSYIRDVHGPFPDLQIVPTGGIAIDRIADWIGAGAAAVGIGSPLTGTSLRDGVDRQLLTRARRAVEAVGVARTVL